MALWRDHCLCSRRCTMETSTSLGVLQGSTAPVLTQSKLHHMWKRGFWDYGGKKLDYGGRRALISETLPFVAIIAAHVVCKSDFFFFGNRTISFLFMLCIIGIFFLSFNTTLKCCWTIHCAMSHFQTLFLSFFFFQMNPTDSPVLASKFSVFPQSPLLQTVTTCAIITLLLKS